MIIHSATYVISSPDHTKSPAPDRPEYAFIGRSNVGKSSLINMLAGNDKLAKTSSAPGKTQLINHFNINDEWYIVDLPGYGFAKRSKTESDSWQEMIFAYLRRRARLLSKGILAALYGAICSTLVLAILFATEVFGLKYALFAPSLFAIATIALGVGLVRFIQEARIGVAEAEEFL